VDGIIKNNKHPELSQKEKRRENLSRVKTQDTKHKTQNTKHKSQKSEK